MPYIHPVDYSLEPIINYKMNDLEAKAYKAGLMWLVLSRKTFPDYKHSKTYPKKGDPRKCLLFKMCYKMVNTTIGILPDNEYKLYIKAQLDVLAAIDCNPLIEPECLAGDKAWVRWKIWKRKYDRLGKNQTASDVGVSLNNIDDVAKDLQKTKIFLQNKFGPEYTEDHIMIAAKELCRLTSIGKITPYYVLLSPWAKKYCKELSIDKELYIITPEIEMKFKEIFKED